ncbi:Mycobacterium numidiamassiliense ORFan [Mycobacterium numidiamassiliense]|uniref:Mycobacterium numidiamassiliense ORFan n=1 Tax=Mycobacterium numidiamassiliense TaxID=1841861 RepID=A0A2U3PIX6_9MYCO|nr:Mycobacterium numidiamassiliense ORFan [Mycobacterium numidiamassiliense]
MLSAIVIYLKENDAGGGFYDLANRLLNEDNEAPVE